MTRLVIITGAPGVGKTTVAHLLADALDGVTARISGDVFVLAVTPFETSDERRSFLRESLASFVRRAVAHAYDWVVIECVIPSDKFIAELVSESGVARENVTTISLLAERSAYELRVRDKLRAEGVTGADLTACHEWMSRIAALRTPIPLDTSRITAAETVAELQRIIASVR